MHKICAMQCSSSGCSSSRTIVVVPAAVVLWTMLIVDDDVRWWTHVQNRLHVLHIRAAQKTSPLFCGALGRACAFVRACAHTRIYGSKVGHSFIGARAEPIENIVVVAVAEAQRVRMFSECRVRIQ